MVAFTGRCLVHRAEIMQLHGAWGDALEEARRAGRRFAETKNPAAGQAFYRQGELHRLQGEFGAAEEAYREASRCGWEPQPGLALLRLAQGRNDVAAAAIRRVAGETTEPLKRAGLLAGLRRDHAGRRRRRGGARAPAASSARSPRPTRAGCSPRWPRTRGSGRPRGGRRPVCPGARAPCVRSSGTTSRRRTRRRGRACSSGWPAARSATTTRPRWSWRRPAASSRSWERRRTSPASTRWPDAPRRDAHGLTPRELEVLRAGRCRRDQRQIAVGLVISEHTVARHVQNIFAKLRVSSRTAARRVRVRARPRLTPPRGQK